MLFQQAISILPFLATLTLGASLTPRSGNHEAVVYSGNGCSGADLGAVVNFGCGGICHQSDNPIYSILLKQDGTGNPKPTASLFAGTNCDGAVVAKAGIFSGEHSGCTDLKNPARSYYLYFNC